MQQYIYKFDVKKYIRYHMSTILIILIPSVLYTFLIGVLINLSLFKTCLYSFLIGCCICIIFAISVLKKRNTVLILEKDFLNRCILKFRQKNEIDDFYKLDIQYYVVQNISEVEIIKNKIILSGIMQYHHYSLINGITIQGVSKIGLFNYFQSENHFIESMKKILLDN